MRGSTRTSHGRRSSEHRRRVGVWLGVLALALHTLIPLGQGVTAPFSAPRSGIPLVICTANGAVPAPSEPGQQRPDPSSCPVCQARALGGALVAVAAVAVPAPRWDAAVHPVVPSGIRLAAWHSGPALPRGPPSVA